MGCLVWSPFGIRKVTPLWILMTLRHPSRFFGLKSPRTFRQSLRQALWIFGTSFLCMSRVSSTGVIPAFGTPKTLGTQANAIAAPAPPPPRPPQSSNQPQSRAQWISQWWFRQLSTESTLWCLIWGEKARLTFPPWDGGSRHRGGEFPTWRSSNTSFSQPLQPLIMG